MLFSEIIDKEKEMLLNAEEKYGEYHHNCFAFIDLMQDFVKETKPDAWIFALFLSQIKKHIVLSFFSALRQHHIQAMLDLRQVFEAGAKGAYSIAFPEHQKFIQTKSNDTAFEPEGLAKEAYDWLEKNYPKGTEPLKKLKKTINESCAHANAIYAFQNFELSKKTRGFEFSFFDKDDSDLVKTDLWFIGNVAMGLMDLFYGVNQGRNLITFSPDFITRLKQYEVVGNKLKAEMMSKERFARFKIQG